MDFSFNSFYFFFPFDLLVMGELDETLPALDVAVEVALLPLADCTALSCLFCRFVSKGHLVTRWGKKLNMTFRINNQKNNLPRHRF